MKKNSVKIMNTGLIVTMALTTTLSSISRATDTTYGPQSAVVSPRIRFNQQVLTQLRGGQTQVSTMSGISTLIPVGPGYSAFNSPLVPPMANNWEDLRVRCSNELAILVRARNVALNIFNSGNKNYAAKYLQSVLDSEAQRLGSYDDGNSSIPNSITALVVGAGLTDTFFKELDQSNVKLRAGNKDGAKWNFVSSIVNLVLEVHSTLDEDYFYFGRCHRGGCGESEYGNRRQFYSDKLGSVVKKLMKVYDDTESVMASDKVNLTMAANFGFASAEILSESMFRREYAEAIIGFADAAEFAKSNVNGEPRAIYMALEQVDYWLDCANKSFEPLRIRLQEYHEREEREEREERGEHKRHKGHHSGYGGSYGGASDDDDENE